MSRPAQHRPRVAVVLNTADAQSVPLELARVMARQRPGSVDVIAFNAAHEGFPSVEGADQVHVLDARGAVPMHALAELRRRLRDVRPDIVHVHLWPSGIWAALLARFGGSMVVKTEHNDVRFSTKGKRVANILIYPLVKTLICNSTSTERSLSRLERLAIGPDRRVIYNGVDFESVRAAQDASARVRSDLGITSGIVIGTVARFVEQKNLVRLVRAFALARERGANEAQLVLVGDGPLRADLEALVRARHLEESVRFTGALPRHRVYEHLAAFDAFVVPSLWEGFCNAAVEAAGAGLPVLASDITTLREVLGPAAVYIDPRDETSIAGAICSVHDSSEADRAAQGTRARDFVTRRYGMETAARQYWAMFDDAYGRRRR